MIIQSAKAMNPPLSGGAMKIQFAEKLIDGNAKK